HDALIQHLTTQDHKKSKLILDNQTIDYRFKYVISKDKLDIIQIMQHVYFLAKHHYATHRLKDLKNLSTQQFNKAKNEALFGPFVGLKKVQSIMDPPNLVCSEYGSYDNDVSAREFLEAISFVIEESLSNEIQNSPYWSIIQLDDAAAQSIVNNINRFLMAKKLDISNMYHIGSGGASTMIGKKNGVATIFKKQNPFLLEHNCIAHRLALAAKDAAEKVPYFENYNSIVNNLYSYFSFSYKQMINLQLVEQTIDDPNLVLLSDYVTISEIYMHLNATINSITTQYIGYNGIPPNYGNFLREYIDEQNILIEELPDFILQFAVATKALFDFSNFSTQFPNIKKLASIFLITPLSNAVVEKVFSHQNLIKTKSQNRLNVSTLHMLLLISLNGPESTIFDWKRAYNYWITKDWCI
ncbi:19898_t:CDS:2, partial [Cetraspora pellucida]